MKTLLSVASIVFLSHSPGAFAQTGFENPDGRPNSIAIEPLFEYTSGGPLDADLIQLGLGFTVPISERVTIRGAGTFGSGEYYKPQARLYELDSRAWVVNDIVRAEHEQIDFRFSVRIWLGGGSEK